MDDAESSEEAKPSFRQHPQADIKRHNPHHDHVPSDEIDLLIETINSNDLGWTADVCKLQKSHRMYDAARCDDTVLVDITEPDPTGPQDLLKFAAELEEAEKAADGAEADENAKPGDIYDVTKHAVEVVNKVEEVIKTEEKANANKKKEEKPVEKQSL